MSEKLIYLNGQIIPENKAMVSCLDPGFLYGQGLFETMRAYNGRVFQLDSHLNRLIRSLAAVSMNTDYSFFQLKEAVGAILEANDLSDAYVRLNMWQGKDNRANICIIVREFGGYPEDLYKRGFKAKIAQSRLNEYSVFVNIKSLNYLQFYLSRLKAEREGFNEAIFLNSKGHISEGSRSNIFLIKKEDIITPALESGCLAGITRQAVIDLAKKENRRIYEKQVREDDLLRADEAFLTSSLLEVMPLTSIDNKPINKGQPGSTTLSLLKSYKDLTKVPEQF